MKKIICLVVLSFLFLGAQNSYAEVEASTFNAAVDELVVFHNEIIALGDEKDNPIRWKNNATELEKKLRRIILKFSAGRINSIITDVNLKIRKITHDGIYASFVDNNYPHDYLFQFNNPNHKAIAATWDVGQIVTVDLGYHIHCPVTSDVLIANVYGNGDWRVYFKQAHGHDVGLMIASRVNNRPFTFYQGHGVFDIRKVK